MKAACPRPCAPRSRAGLLEAPQLQQDHGAAALVGAFKAAVAVAAMDVEGLAEELFGAPQVARGGAEAGFDRRNTGAGGRERIGARWAGAGFPG